MIQSTFLYKTATVVVHRPAEQGEGTDGPLVLKTDRHSLLVEAEAAELLVAYLRVIQAYFSAFPQSGRLIAQLTRRVAGVLADCLQQSGQPMVLGRDVSELIRQLGCVDDWRNQYPPPA